MKNSLTLRQDLVFQDWVKFANLKYLSPKSFINALVTSKRSPKWKPDFEDIKKRYFYLFYSDKAKQSPIEALESYNLLLERLEPFLRFISEDTWEKAFLSAVKNFEGIPFVSYTATLLSNDFYLPDGRKIIEAYQAKSNFLELPKGSIIHTTARIAEKNQFFGELEKEGLENFYQVYLPSQDLYTDLVNQRDQLKADESFLSYEDEQNRPKALLPASQLLVFNSQLAQAIKLEHRA